MEAQNFLAAVYGAMLAARAFDDPVRFSAIVEAFLRRIRVGAPTRKRTKVSRDRNAVGGRARMRAKEK
jgi:hypothetical protein